MRSSVFVPFIQPVEALALLKRYVSGGGEAL